MTGPFKPIGTVRLHGLTPAMRDWYRRLRREGKLSRYEANLMVLGALIWAQGGQPATGTHQWHLGEFTGARP